MLGVQAVAAALFSARITQRRTDLARNQRLARAWRTVQQHALHVLYAKLGERRRGEETARECASEDIGEFGI